MSKLNSHLRDKQNLKLKASLAKPQSPKYGEQANIAKALYDMDENFDSQIRKEESDSIDRMSKKWSGHERGSVGGAFVEGLNSGMKQGSILDDKKRMSKFKSTLEKFSSMLEAQNEELAKQERLSNARDAIMPNWFAYAKSFRSMSPSDREQAVDSMISKYNQVAGTNYRRGPVDAREPWKVTVIDGDEASVIDLTELMKTPEEMKVEMMMQTPEYRKMEAGLQQEENLDNQLKNATIAQRQAKASQTQKEMETEQGYKDLENQILQDTGDSVEVLDRFRDKPSQWNYAVKDIEEGIKAGNAARQSIELIRDLKGIVKRNPKIFSSLGAILENNQRTHPTALGTIMQNLSISQKDRADFSEANKIIAQLYATGLHTLPKGSRLNQYLEKEVRKKYPDLSMIPKAIDTVSNHLEKEYMEIYDEGLKRSDYYQKGLKYKPKVKPLDNTKELQAEDPTLTPEMIKEAERRLNGKR